MIIIVSSIIRLVWDFLLMMDSTREKINHLKQYNDESMKNESLFWLLRYTLIDFFVI